MPTETPKAPLTKFILWKTNIDTNDVPSGVRDAEETIDAAKVEGWTLTHVTSSQSGYTLFTLERQAAPEEKADA